MFSLLLLFFVGYAVKCEDISSYYVIEMPEYQIPTRQSKTFQVYWNVPTMQCQSKGIPFHNLYERYGIIQNNLDSFRGEKIAILYDPGDFPALLKNESSGKFKFRNGGVPQQGSLDHHLEAFKTDLDNSIPDRNFNGLGIIDFESWRPIFRQNFGVLVPYRDVSLEIEKKTHWWWPKSWLLDEARVRFEVAARQFMQTTISLAKQLRPKAVWGYYGFPYCFNMATNHMEESCASGIKGENDNIHWLWSESLGLYPSVYTSKHLSASQLIGLIRGRLRESERVKVPGTIVLPYFWYKYREGGYLTEEDLQVAIKTLYELNVSGFIMWGSSNDVNTVEKCLKLKNYLEQIMGPAIAKYTKHTRLNEGLNYGPYVSNATNEMKENTTDVIKVTAGTNTTHSTENVEHANHTLKLSTDPDPEFDWIPPENYTQDISKNVIEVLRKTSQQYDYDEGKQITETVLNNFNLSLLDDIIRNKTDDTTKKSDINFNINGIKFIRVQHINFSSIRDTIFTNSNYSPTRASVPLNKHTSNTFDVTGSSLRDIIENNKDVTTMQPELQKTNAYQTVENPYEMQTTEISTNKFNETINHNIPNSNNYNLILNKSLLFPLSTLEPLLFSITKPIKSNDVSLDNARFFSGKLTVLLSHPTDDPIMTEMNYDTPKLHTKPFVTSKNITRSENTEPTIVITSIAGDLNTEETFSETSDQTLEFVSEITTTNDYSAVVTTTHTYENVINEKFSERLDPSTPEENTSTVSNKNLNIETDEDTSNEFGIISTELVQVTSTTEINKEYPELDFVSSQPITILNSVILNNLSVIKPTESLVNTEIPVTSQEPSTTQTSILNEDNLRTEIPENFINREYYTKSNEFNRNTPETTYPTNTTPLIDITLGTDHSTDVFEEIVTDSINTQKEEDNLNIVIEDTEKIEPTTSLSLTTISSPKNQVTGSATRQLLGRKYIICLMFYLYSFSKCICDIYGRCP